MRRIRKFELENKEVLFFGTVKGLVSERKILRNIAEEFKPELILLGISPEEMVGLKNYLKKPFNIEPDDYEVIYAKKLENFGEVGLPVPTYLEAFLISKEMNIDMLPLDIPDEKYASIFTKNVNIFHLLIFNMRKRKIWRMDFNAKTPEDFVIKWDEVVNKLSSYRKVELERETYMGKKIKENIKMRNENKILVVIELERFRGVLKNLNLLQIT